MAYYLFFNKKTNVFVAYTKSKETAYGFMHQRKDINKLKMKKVASDFFDKEARSKLDLSCSEIFDYHGTYLLPDEEDSVATECYTMFSQAYIILGQYLNLMDVIKLNDADETTLTPFNALMHRVRMIMQKEHYEGNDPLLNIFRIDRVAMEVINNKYKKKDLGEE